MSTLSHGRFFLLIPAGRPGIIRSSEDIFIREVLISMNKYAGTQTEKNLMEAFAGESQARNKYT